MMVLDCWLSHNWCLPPLSCRSVREHSTYNKGTLPGNAAVIAQTVILILALCDQVTVVHSRNEGQTIGMIISRLKLPSLTCCEYLVEIIKVVSCPLVDIVYGIVVSRSTTISVWIDTMYTYIFIVDIQLYWNLSRRMFGQT